MKRILALAIVALVVPSVALAGKPSNPGQSQETHGNSQSASQSQAAPTVLYVLKGVITGFNSDSAAQFTLPGTGDGTGNDAVVYSCDNGSVTITVARVNHQLAKFEQLPGQPTQPSHPPLSLQLTVCLSAKTKVVVRGSGLVDLADIGSISLDTTNGNYGIVKVRYAKKFDPTDLASDGDLSAFLQSGAKQVIVKKPVPASSSS